MSYPSNEYSSAPRWYGATIAVCTLLLLLRWWFGGESDRHFHTLVESVALLLAFIGAALAFVRYFATGNTFFFCFATAMFGTGSLDLVHAILTSSWVASLHSNNLEALIPWSWLASRCFLAFSMLWCVSHWSAVEGSRFSDWQVRRILIGVAGLTMLCFAMFIVLPIAPTTFGSSAVPRPFELLAGVGFLISIWQLRKTSSTQARSWQLGFKLFLWFGVFSQCVLMPFSQSLFDGSFDMAHFVKVFSYALAVAMLLRNTRTRFIALNHERLKVKMSEMSLQHSLRELHMRERVMQLLVNDAPVKDVLTVVMRHLETVRPDLIGSVLIYDIETHTLRSGAAPSLPDAYNEAVNGIGVQVGVGSCGSAAALKQSVIVEDVLTHPYWRPYRALVDLGGIRACWSTPILDAHGELLGTFAIYHLTPQSPGESELKLIDDVTVLCRMILERVRSTEKIKKMAYFDLLTNLPNRRHFMDRSKLAIQNSARSGKYCALLYLDLDGFKLLNDTFGHDAGDALLVETASRMKAVVRTTDCAARLGGDEFIVLMENLPEHGLHAWPVVRLVAEKLRQSLAIPFDLSRTNANSYQMSCSIGVTLFVGNQHSIDALMHQADEAMYEAKRAGKNGIRFYQPSVVSFAEPGL